MKSLPAVILPIALLAGASDAALAQVKPKPVATVTVRPDGTIAATPKPQTPADTAKAMAQAERQAIQSDLAWTSFYNGAINGEVSERMVTAIKAFQKDIGAKDTGVLNPQERTALAEAARKLQDNVGWKITTDMVTGARIGLPLKLLAKTTSDANGSKWSSATGTIQIALDRRKEAGATTASVASTEKKAFARKTDYSVVKPDFFVLSGMQGLKKFYIRGQTSNNEVRVLSIMYDQATEGTMIPVTVAMSSAFNPFPGSSTTQDGPPRKKVEYSTGIVVNANGTILADRQAIDGCESVIVAGYGNADKGAQDETGDLALLRLYGASGLQALSIGEGAAKSDVIVTGIADPQNQGGGNVASSMTAVTGSGGSETVLSPSPALGFSGAALTDSDGKFAGVAKLRQVVIAGPGVPANQSSFVPAATVRDFLRANNVTTASGSSNAKAAVVRLICVRK
ncbi:MAG: peptidoglycan-binding protein [Xanthobacteraceae bacterium]|nr:peptidoglycan-binding protein [Xanthobacteraceae bacterium]